MESNLKKHGLFMLGVTICFAVAGLSIFVEKIIPGELLGASIVALFMGTIINTFFHPSWIKPALKFTSKRILFSIIGLSKYFSARASPAAARFWHNSASA